MSSKKKTEPIQHFLIPKHVKLSDKEKSELLSKYGITAKELPKLFSSEPAVSHLDAKPGDVVKIVRKSPTSGETTYYRAIV